MCVTSFLHYVKINTVIFWSGLLLLFSLFNQTKFKTLMKRTLFIHKKNVLNFLKIHVLFTFSFYYTNATLHT